MLWIRLNISKCSIGITQIKFNALSRSENKIGIFGNVHAWLFRGSLFAILKSPFLNNSPLYFHLLSICRALELARSWLVGGSILRCSHPGYPFPVSASDN